MRSGAGGSVGPRNMNGHARSLGSFHACGDIAFVGWFGPEEQWFSKVSHYAFGWSRWLSRWCTSGVAYLCWGIAYGWRKDCYSCIEVAYRSKEVAYRWSNVATVVKLTALSQSIVGEGALTQPTWRQFRKAPANLEPPNLWTTVMTAGNLDLWMWDSSLVRDGMPCSAKSVRRLGPNLLIWIMGTGHGLMLLVSSFLMH
jgi:hypothetical protein